MTTTGANGRKRAERPRIWEGILPRFPAVVAGAAFSSKRWIERQRAEAEELMRDPSAPSSGGTLLSEVLAGWLSARPGSVNVLDFGGGFALDYLRLKGRGFPVGSVNFCVVEVPGVCREARRLHRSVSGVSFQSRLPGLVGSVDVFHAASSLQYLKDWQGFLDRVGRLRPRLLVFGGVLAGEIPTFVTLQNYYGTRIPVWFLNKAELLAHLDSLGYERIFDGVAEARYFGRVRPLPMRHFPESHRLAKKCNLVFRLKDAAHP